MQKEKHQDKHEIKQQASGKQNNRNDIPKINSAE